MGIEKQDLNVKKSPISFFYNDLAERLLTISGWGFDKPLSEDDIEFKAARKPMMVLGLPGIGKTAGVGAKIAELNKLLADVGYRDEEGIIPHFDLKEIKLGQTNPGDLQAIPVTNMNTGELEEISLNLIPKEEYDHETGEGKYGVLFFDEVTSADTMVVQPVLGATDSSRTISGQKLPKHWLVIAAGNGPECTNFESLSQMTISRFAPLYDIEYSSEDWRANCDRVMSDTDNRPCIHQDVKAYTELCPQDILSAVDGEDSVVANPRAWESLSQLIYGLESDVKAQRDKNIQTGISAENSRALAKFKGIHGNANTDVSSATYDPLNEAFASLVMGTVGTSVGSRFLEFLTQKSDEYSVEKILEGKEKRCNLSNKSTVSKNGAPSEAVANLQFLITGCIEHIKIDFRKYLNLCDLEGVDYTQYFSTNGTSEAAKLAEKIIAEFNHTVYWFLDSDSLDMTINFFSLALKELDKIDNVQFWMPAVSQFTPKTLDIYTNALDSYPEIFTADVLNDVLDSDF